jgi:hypothetical protein
MAVIKGKSSARTGRLVVRWVAIALAGTALGLASAALAVRQVGAAGALRVGPWATPLDAGGPGRGMYLRAAAALGATLALSRSEAIYFRAATDSGGGGLRGGCDYTVHGGALPARWWSITLYGADHRLIANPQNRYAYASVDVGAAADGAFLIHVGPHEKPGNWLNTAGENGFVLLTRLYQPSPAVAADPAHIALPVITLVGCS